MTNKELLEYNRKREICQICIVVEREIEEVLKDWVEKLKVGPWTVITISDENVKNATLDGRPITEPFKYICAEAMYGSIQIEILKHVYGPFAAKPFLARTGGGLQHFKEKVADPDMQERICELTGAGYRMNYGGHLAADQFYNFDTEASLGFALEIGNFADIQLPEDMYYIYPRENDGKDC